MIESCFICKYRLDDDFYCLITVDQSDCFEVWLFKEGYGVSDLMFGGLNMSVEQIIFLVKENANLYISDFLQKYADC